MIDEVIVAQAPLSGLKAEDDSSAVSWAAVIGGAFVAAAFTLILVTLGAGIGLISVSPWSSNNPSVTTFGVLAAAWFIAVQLFACGVGGYLAGRLRTKWAARPYRRGLFSRHRAWAARLGRRSGDLRCAYRLGRKLGGERGRPSGRRRD